MRCRQKLPEANCNDDWAVLVHGGQLLSTRTTGGPIVIHNYNQPIRPEPDSILLMASEQPCPLR